jgi:predicted dienelactone hydrolase
MLICIAWAAPTALYAHDDGPVGYTTVTVPLGDTGGIPCAVRYPATDGETRAVYAQGKDTRTGGAFTGGAPDTRGGPYPLVIYSHGYSGCSTASAYLCEALAAAGFVVAAPDHSDDLKICSLRPGYRPELFVGFRILFSAIELGKDLAAGDYNVEDFRYRFDQIKSAIDYLLAQSHDNRSPFFGLIDAEHIGAVGHSLGGFSVMVAAGARDVGIDFPIDAVVSMSGPGGSAFSCSDMKRITIPVMLMYGKIEEGSREKGAGLLAQYRCLAGPKFLMGVVGGDHLAFSERLFFDSSQSLKHARGDDERQGLIARRVTAFFELYLAGKREAAEILEKKDPGLDPSYFSF